MSSSSLPRSRLGIAANAAQLESMKIEVTATVAAADKLLRLCVANEAAMRNIQSVLKSLQARNIENEAVLAKANAKIEELMVVSAMFMIKISY